MCRNPPCQARVRERARLEAALSVASALLAMALSSRAEAQAKDAPALPAQRASVSSLAQLADDVAKLLPALPGGTLVAVAPVRSDVALARGDELAARLAQVVAGRVGGRAHGQPVALSVARGLADRAPGLVYVQPEVARGELRLVVDLYPVVTNAWERLRNPLPGPRAHGFAGAPIDAEIRTFLPPIALEQAKLARAKHGEGDVLAAACGDIDGDGGQEIVLVSRGRVASGRLRGGVFVVEKSSPWAELVPRAPAPLREPLATAWIVPRGIHGSLLVGLSDRGGASLGGDLQVRHLLSGLPISPVGGGLCASPSAEHGALEGLLRCTTVPGSREPFASLAPRFDGLAELEYVDARGAPHSATVVREPSGKLRVRIDGAESTLPEAAGAQLALGDLDLDGVPELIASGEGADDRLSISSLASPAGASKPRLRFDAKEGVRALAVCPPEERGVPALVAVVGSEVWLVR